MTYNNVKSHKKAGFHSLSRKHIFGKTIGRGQIDTPSLLRVKELLIKNTKSLILAQEESRVQQKKCVSLNSFFLLIVLTIHQYGQWNT